MNTYLKIVLFTVLIISIYVVYDYYVNKRKPYVPEKTTFNREITQEEANQISLKMFLIEQNKTKDLKLNKAYDDSFEKYRKYLNDNNFDYVGYPVAITYYK